jgi:pimeloyl-ACP methyl ester carboxylesterase
MASSSCASARAFAAQDGRTSASSQSHPVPDEPFPSSFQSASRPTLRSMVERSRCRTFAAGLCPGLACRSRRAQVRASGVQSVARMARVQRRSGLARGRHGTAADRGRPGSERNPGGSYRDAHPAAYELAHGGRFWCYVAGDDDGWNRLGPALRERLCACASTLFAVELGSYELYLPDDETLASLATPVRLLVSEHGLPFFAEIAGRFGERLGVDVAITPDRHDAYHEHPSEFAEAMRPFLREVSGERT